MDMNKIYNKKRHFELLQKKSMDILSEANASELRKYSSMLDSHLTWETRDQYLELIEKFLEKKIPISEFCSEFCDRGQLNSDAVTFLTSNLILLSPDEKSWEFGELLEEVFLECEFFDGEEDLTGEEFRNAIEGSFVKIQNYLTEE